MSTAFKQVADNATSTTSTTLSGTGVTSIVTATADGAKFPAPGNGFILTIWNGTDPAADANMEKVTCTARSSDTLTISATTKTHTSPANIGILNASGRITELQTAVNTLETNNTGTNTGDQTSVTGNAGTATKLATARAINGVNFDGSAAITIIPRVNTTASSATPSINTDTTDVFTITALAAAINTMTTNLTGTPVAGQKLIIRIKDNGTARAITWGTSFISSGVATLPTTTVISKTHLIGLIYDEVATKWVCVAVDATGY